MKRFKNWPDDQADKIIAPIVGPLMPGMGNCETLEGEVLRAICKIRYRFYNDGDVWWEGYGCETAGPAMAFLKEILNNHPFHRSKACRIALNLLRDTDNWEGEGYSGRIDTAGVILAQFIKAQEILTPNDANLDMLDWKSQYEDTEDDDDICPDCSEPEMYCTCDEEEWDD